MATPLSPEHYGWCGCSDVEAVAEEIRRDAVSRRCHVNHGEVESLALVLSQLSRAMAQLKSMLEPLSPCS